MNEARLAAVDALGRTDVPCDVPDTQGAFYYFLRVSLVARRR